MARAEQCITVHLRQPLRKVPPKVIGGARPLQRRTGEGSQTKKSHKTRNSALFLICLYFTILGGRDDGETSV